MRLQLIAQTIACVTVAVASPACAGTFVFTSGTNTPTYGASGVGTSSTVNGVTVTATAWSTSGLASSNTPDAAYLGKYQLGYGVTNGAEGFGNVDNSHTIDNVGSYDFIRLVFSTPVTLTNVMLNGFSVNGGLSVDTDAWLSYGNGAFDTATLWQGYLTRGVEVASGASFANSNAATVWLIGAARTTNDRDDGFKLASVTVAAVPEPATWGFMLLGFGAMGLCLRRQIPKTAGKAVLALV